MGELVGERGRNMGDRGAGGLGCWGAGRIRGSARWVGERGVVRGSGEGTGERVGVRESREGYGVGLVTRVGTGGLGEERGWRAGIWVRGGRGE